ncbi:hypothetical protein SAMN05421812_101230 [Asanoa hainanensis]|uniref:Uncharacterized protein n=2 Tax=Asanoa hainanensis TaxID=560556 RepID=A0A239G593_9ACTN|nr:hypothetical protein SAMN05421812_101230 [Asanoa hainanensis]
MDALIRVADDGVLGRGRTEDFPMVAAQALARGVDLPALRELAGLGRDDVRDAADLFERAMTELGHPLREGDAIRWARIREAATSLLEKRTAPPNAAGEIAELLRTLDDPDGRTEDFAWHLHVLSVIWEDHPADRPDTVATIKSTVSEIIGYRR